MRYKSYIILILRKLKAATIDLAPILAVVVFFQTVVIRQPFPQIGEVILGFVFVVVGLMLFVEGLEIALFPIGETMAYALAKKGSLLWLIVFAFALGFSTTIAEPALIAVTKEASIISSGAGLIENNQKTIFSINPFVQRRKGDRCVFSRLVHRNRGIAHSQRVAHILFDHRGIYSGDADDCYCP